MGGPRPWASPPVGRPAFTTLKRSVCLGARFCMCYQTHCLRPAGEGFPSPQRSAMYYCTQLHLMHIPASSLQVWCDGCGIPPPTTWVRCSLTMHTGLAEHEFTYLQLISTLLTCYSPLWVSPPSKPISW